MMSCLMMQSRRLAGRVQCRCSCAVAAAVPHEWRKSGALTYPFANAHAQLLNPDKLDVIQVQQRSEQQADTLTTLAAGAVQQEAQLQDFQALLEAMQGGPATLLMDPVQKVPCFSVWCSHHDATRVSHPAVVSSKQFTLLLSALPHINHQPTGRQEQQSRQAAGIPGQQTKAESQQRHQRQHTHGQQQQQQQQQSSTATSTQASNGALDSADTLLADAWGVGSGALPPQSAFHESPVSSSSHAV